jgi:hypothetical protein
MTVVKLRPIVKTIDLSHSTRDAFRLFTEEISAWWPLQRLDRRIRKGLRGVRGAGIETAPGVLSRYSRLMMTLPRARLVSR